MFCEPLFGHAVQAPIVIEPKATPRVSDSQVAPRPIAAASMKVKKEPKSKRMTGCVQSPRGTGDDFWSAAAATAFVRLPLLPSVAPIVADGNSCAASA